MGINLNFKKFFRKFVIVVRKKRAVNLNLRENVFLPKIQPIITILLPGNPRNLSGIFLTV